MQLPKAFKNRGHFPSNAAATKLIFLVLRDITKKWGKPADHLEVSGNPIRRTILCDSNLKIMQRLPTAEKLGILKVQLQEPMNLGLCSNPSSGETIAGVVLNLAS
jgi:hypothetical protein